MNVFKLLKEIKKEKGMLVQLQESTSYMVSEDETIIDRTTFGKRFWCLRFVEQDQAPNQRVPLIIECITQFDAFKTQ